MHRAVQNRCLTLCIRRRCPPDPLSLRPRALVLVCAGGDQRLAHSCLTRRSRTTRPDLDVPVQERSIAIADADRSLTNTHCMLCSCRLLLQRL